jgi:hypothetical protein
MGRRGLALLVGCAVAGCTPEPHPAQTRAPVAVAPITAAQVGDLLSPNVQNKDGNVFVTVEPDRCAGAAREVDPPLVVDQHPIATDGGHWATSDDRQVYIEELAGVYRADFDARAALSNAQRTIEACRGVPFTVVSMRGRTYAFELQEVDAASPGIVRWSYRGSDWACDNAFVAAHNAAVELTTCAPVNGYDVLSLARAALQRIERLANTAA